MPRLNRRSKVISIRLSNEEYDQLQTLCASKGVDSISGLARTAMKVFMLQEHKNGKVAIESRVDEMHVRMSVLDREVARLTSLIGVARCEDEQ